MKPQGREQVRAALLAAAAELFADRGPSAVSVREVAARAGVNHGLVHRHFGSKEALLRDCMTELTRQIADEIDSSAPLLEVPADLLARLERSAYWKVLARALLDGADPKQLQESFPVVAALLADVRRALRQGQLAVGTDPRVLTAMGVAFGLGWLLFEPFLLVSTGLGRRSRGKVRAQVFATWMKLLRE